MVICHMDHTGLLAMVIAAEEVELGGACEIRGSINGVLVHGDVTRLTHVNAVEHIVAGDGIGNTGIQIVEVNIGNVVGEENLILLA